MAVLTAGLLCVAGGAQDADPNSFETLLKKGFQLHREARFSEAIPVLEQARVREPEDYFANLLLGIDQLRTGDVKAAIPRLQVAARVRSGEAIPEEYLGEAEARLGDYALAAQAYQAAVARGHRSEDALEAWAGFARERFHDLGERLRASDAGVSALERMRKEAADPEAALGCRASIALLERRLAAETRSAGNENAAAETARKLSVCYSLEAGTAAGELKSDAEDMAAVHKLRGDVLLRLKGDAAGAQEEYRQAIAQRPGNPTLLERLAEAQLTAGDTAGARQSAKAALAVNPHEREAMRTLATIAMNERDYAEAVSILKELAAEAPGDLGVQVELGRALAQTGDAAGALEHLQPALARGYPDEKGALHALEARVLRQLGREEEAAKASAEARRRSDAFQARTKEGGREKSSANQ
jgi:predicted Zn-dependent protease